MLFASPLRCGHSIELCHSCHPGLVAAVRIDRPHPTDNDLVTVVEDLQVRIGVHIPPVARRPGRYCGRHWQRYLEVTQRAARDRILERASMCVIGARGVLSIDASGDT